MKNKEIIEYYIKYIKEKYISNKSYIHFSAKRFEDFCRELITKALSKTNNESRLKKKCFICGEPCTRYRCRKCYTTKKTSVSSRHNTKKYNERKKNARLNT